MWDGGSFIIGFLIGLIVLLILTTLLYSSRVFIFARCTTDNRICRASDYYNLPGRALAEGASVSEILTINDEGQLVYRRVPRNLCRPGPNQDIIIRYPQYCRFTAENGISFDARNAGIGSNKYSPVNGLDVTITTEQNCVPVSSTVGNVVSGEPLIRWDPATEADI